MFGSIDAERVLLFLAARDSGYGREIADYWQTSVNGIQRQLDKFESGGILESRQVGRTRVYGWNPRWVFRNELKALLGRAITFLPKKERDRLEMVRKRPRRRGKVL